MAVPKRGYKFIAPLSTGQAAAASPKVQASSRRVLILAAAGFAVVALAVSVLFFWTLTSSDPGPAVIAVSVFDNETGSPEYDRPVAGLSDLVVERLSKLDPVRLSVIGNAAVLRQPRNIRNLKVVEQTVKADDVLLGQLQKGEDGLRFIPHFIRLQDETHLKANRLPVAPNLTGLETAVVNEFERATREHVLTRPAK